MQRRHKGRSNNGVTPLHLLCKLDFKRDEVQYLLQRLDVQINIRDINEKTPLHYACKYLDKEIVGMLLHHPDVDVNATDNLNDTPLYKTLIYYHNDSEKRIAVIQKILDHPSLILIDQKNNNNKTPLDVMKDRLNKLEMMKKQHTTSQKDELQYVMKVISLSNEALNKERWQLYCCYLKTIMEV